MKSLNRTRQEKLMQSANISLLGAVLLIIGCAITIYENNLVQKNELFNMAVRDVQQNAKVQNDTLHVLLVIGILIGLISLNTLRNLQKK